MTDGQYLALKRAIRTEGFCGVILVNRIGGRWLFLSPAPLSGPTERFAPENAVNRLEKDDVDRWQRNEGQAAPAKKRRGPPEGNLNPMKHGIFANQCPHLNEEERQSFDERIDRLYQDFEFNLSACGTHRQASRATSCSSSWWPSTRSS